MDALLRSLKASLNPRAYRIARLHWVHEWKQARIARRLGMSREGVRKHLANVKRVARAVAVSMKLDVDGPRRLAA